MKELWTESYNYMKTLGMDGLFLYPKDNELHNISTWIYWYNIEYARLLV